MSIRKISESNIASKTLRSSSVASPSQFIAFGGPSSGNVNPYTFAWNNSTGIGTRYAFPSSAMSGTQIVDNGVNALGTAIAYIIDGTALAVYAFNASTGYGSRYTNPAGLVFNVPSWSSDNKVFASGSTTSNTSVYSWSDATGFGAKFANPSSFASVNPNGAMVFNVTLNIVAQPGGFNSPWIHAWSFNTTTGFGAKFANPTSLPGNESYSCYFSGANQNGSALIGSMGNLSPYTYAYAMTSSGFGTRYANPTTPLSQGFVEQMQTAPDGKSIHFSGGSSPFIGGYPWNDLSGYGIKYANPSTLPTAATAEISVSNDSSVVCVSRGISSGGCGIYAFNSITGYGTKYANPTGITNTVANQFSRNV